MMNFCLPFWPNTTIDDNSQKQIQQQINKQDQKLLQLQAQYNSNKILVLLLSSAENVAAKLNPNIERKYTCHDFCHSFESKSLDSLVLQLIDQIETFEASYNMYKKEYKKEYDFPYDKKTGKGINKKMIIEDMNYLINNTKQINNYYSKYFGAIINIMNDKPIPNFDLDVNSLNIKDKNRETKCNPKELQQIYPILLQQGNEENKEIEDNYNKDKNYKIIIEKSDLNNNNQVYEKKIQERLRMLKGNKENPDEIKSDLKYSELGSINYFKDFPFLVVTNINKILKDDNYSFLQQNNLYQELKKNKKSNLYSVLKKFFKKYLKYDNKTIDEIIDVTCEEIYKSKFCQNMQ